MARVCWCLRGAGGHDVSLSSGCFIHFFSSPILVFDQLDVVSYEEVVRLPAFKRKTLVLIGTGTFLSFLVLRPSFLFGRTPVFWTGLFWMMTVDFRNRTFICTGWGGGNKNCPHSKSDARGICCNPALSVIS